VLRWLVRALWRTVAPVGAAAGRDGVCQRRRHPPESAGFSRG